MKYITSNNELTVMHRQGFPLAELRDPGDGGQVYVLVHANEWSKKHDLATHIRYFRNRADAINFINKTFK